MLKNTLIRVLVIVACATGLGLADQWRRPVKLSLAPNAAPNSIALPVASDPGTSTHTSTAANPVAGSPTAQPSSPSQVQPQPQPQGPHVTLAQAYDLWNQGVTFLDARTKTEYLADHIRGAKLLDPSEFTSNESRALIATLHPSLPLVIYCGGGDCHASENLAIFLQQAGYQQLHILHDGFPAWKGAGYDITTGDQP
jgi:rhodanese-related sulfurtransferase